jgi:hypothetical protein
MRSNPISTSVGHRTNHNIKHFDLDLDHHRAERLCSSSTRCADHRPSDRNHRGWRLWVAAILTHQTHPPATRVRHSYNHHDLHQARFTTPLTALGLGAVADC